MEESSSILSRRIHLSLTFQTEEISVGRIVELLEQQTRKYPHAVLLLAPIEPYEQRLCRSLLEKITMSYALILPPWEEEDRWPSKALWKWRIPRMRWCDPSDPTSRSMHRYAAIKEAFRLAEKIWIVDAPEGSLSDGHTSTKALIEMQKKSKHISEFCFLEGGSSSVQSIQSVR